MPLLVMTVIAKAIPRPSDQSAVAVDKHVSRMRVGVVIAVAQDLSHERAEQTARDLMPIDRRGRHRIKICHRAANDLVHH